MRTLTALARQRDVVPQAPIDPDADGPCIASPFVLHSDAAYARHVMPLTPVDEIPADWRFLINSMPKSGTVWVAAMLSAALPEDARRRVDFAHACDRPNTLTDAGTRCVVLVRDFRDIVVSLFHETQRNDRRAGYDRPRFERIEAFYFEHLLGVLRTSPLYGRGNLEPWLDFVSAQAFPILRFEDLLEDSEMGLAKIMAFWKVKMPSEKISAIAKAHHFSSMAKARGGGSVPVERLISQGHLREGKEGIWREEMPERVANDISTRFAAYQKRLGYV